jgi:glutamate racemase
VGGLTVLREIMKRLPHEDLIYFGDTARVPYGIKSAETVSRYSIEIANYLMDKGIKILVVACNTASSVAISELTSRLTIPVLGVLIPGARAAVNYTANKKVGVIGTESTIGSNSYVTAINDIDPEVKVYSRACPLFVPLAEEGWAEHPLTRLVVKEYLETLQETGIDTLVLGCTHYPILKSAIREVMGDGIRLVDSAQETALEVERMLESSGRLRDENQDPLRKFYVTDAPDRFKKVGERFLKHPFLNVEKVTL